MVLGGFDCFGGLAGIRLIVLYMSFLVIVFIFVLWFDVRFVIGLLLFCVYILAVFAACLACGCVRGYG